MYFKSLSSPGLGLAAAAGALVFLAGADPALAVAAVFGAACLVGGAANSAS